MPRRIWIEALNRIDMEREDYAGLIYVLANMLAMLMFLSGLVVYLFLKQINIYLVGIGLLMILIGFAAKRFIDVSEKK